MLDVEQIGRYKINRELGRGGMATVYLAHDPRFERDVAIKVLPRQFTHDPRFLTRFEREAKTIAALEHPAIVPVYDFGEHDDAPFLVMRYMAGGSLRQRMQGEPLPLPEIKRILDRLAPALDKAHGRGVVHRDLKPDNVLFDEDNLPYLADFGIARLAEATQTMTIVGTPAYMSPEQVQGQGQLDGRSDIYAVGVMLFEMLTGSQPYQADTPTRQMMQHLLEPIPDVVAANPDLSPSWQTVIDTVMAKEPEARYATAAELTAAMGDLLAEDVANTAPVPLITPAAAPPPTTPQIKQARSPLAKTVIDTPPELAVPPAQRRFKLPAWAWWGGALLLLLLLVWGISGMFDGGTEGEAAQTAEALAAVAEPTFTPTPTATPDPNTPPNPTLGSSWQRPADEMTMVYVPGGTFPMGSENGRDDEQPVHDVTLDGFWIDQTEVTNAQYALCVEADKCEPSRLADNADYNGGSQPVVGVSWYDAEAYCEWVGGQLPTEAQWEYAARGADGRIYPWGNETPDCELANFGDCVGSTAPVGNYAEGASWVDAMDMAGNVWEWVADWYESDYYASSPANNPQGPDDGQSKVLRGGGWFNSGDFIRAAYRNSSGPTNAYDNTGLRCAQE